MEKKKTSLNQDKISIVSFLMSLIIGGGIFYVVDDVLALTAGNTLTAILAFAIGGIIMMLCAKGLMNIFKENPNAKSIIRLAEVVVGKKYAYILGWFLSVVYYPTITAVLAFLCSKFTLEIFGSKDFASGSAMIIALGFFAVSIAINYLAPFVSNFINVASPIIKAIPIIAMALVGIIVGLVNGNVVSNFSVGGSFSFSGLVAAIVASTFAFEGWIFAATKASKNRVLSKTLPLSLGLVIILYVLFYFGISGYADFSGTAILYAGQNSAYAGIFSVVGNIIFKVFILFAAFHTLIKMSSRCMKGLYNLSCCNYTDNLKSFSEKDEKSGFALKSNLVGILLTITALLYYYFAVIDGSMFKLLKFDSLQLVIVTLYGLLVPLFFKTATKKEDVNYKTSLIAAYAAIALIAATLFTHGVAPMSISSTQKETLKPIKISVDAREPVINDGGNKVAIDSGTFKINGNEYIVDGTAIRLTFPKDVDSINFKNSSGSVDITPTTIKKNYILVYYSAGQLTEVQYNGNIKFSIEDKLTVNLTRTTSKKDNACPIIPYVVITGIVMAAGLYIYKNKNTKKETLE